MRTPSYATRRPASIASVGPRSLTHCLLLFTSSTVCFFPRQVALHRVSPHSGGTRKLPSMCWKFSRPWPLMAKYSNSGTPSRKFGQSSNVSNSCAKTSIFCSASGSYLKARNQNRTTHVQGHWQSMQARDESVRSGRGCGYYTMSRL